MWGSHLGRRDPNLALIGRGRKLDARSLSKTPPSPCAPPPLLSWAVAVSTQRDTSARCLHPSPGTPNSSILDLLITSVLRVASKAGKCCAQI
ncbi:uncharacterized protein B0H64DRAFT_380297 [Chaetomium fimeti]|uniref:Uncharacterized protein n=1 Tax=Chaetomium fimeti TaxID=1854472 RepID=A0AAE0HPY3_9PEZI|nr:hypothetical protein B0H64DRAFT_380297 [Chaetomium fimeti]